MRRLQQKKELAREPELEELCEKLEKILEMGDDGIIVTEETGRVEYVNTIASGDNGVFQGRAVQRRHRVVPLGGVAATSWPTWRRRSAAMRAGRSAPRCT